jgi:hypothetical protein
VLKTSARRRAIVRRSKQKHGQKQANAEYFRERWRKNRHKFNEQRNARRGGGGGGEGGGGGGKT